MATLGGASGGRSSWGQRIGLSIERCCVKRVWKHGTMRIRLCRYCGFCPSLDGLVERLYRKKLIVAYNVRSVV